MNRNKFLSDEEHQKLLELVLKYPGRDAAILLTALYTGARATEILNITKTDMNDEFCSIYIKGIKNSRDREIPLPPDMYNRIKQYIPFGIGYDRLHDIWQNYRVVSKKFHALRHTFAINLYKKTRDIKLVQLALGHKNIANTMVYVDFVYSQEELRARILA